MKQKLQTLFSPKAIAIICSFLMILTIFLPYAHAKKDFMEELSYNANYYSSAGINYKKLINPSLITYLKIYQTIDETSATIFKVLIGINVFFIGLTLLSAFKQKPIMMAIFNLLSILVFSIISKTHNQFIDTNNYNLSIAYYLFFISCILVFVCAIWMISIKKVNASK